MRFRTEAVVVLVLMGAPVAASAGQAGYPSPSSFPAHPAYRTPDDTPTRRLRPTPQPSPSADDPTLAGQVDYGSAPDPVPQADPGAGYQPPSSATGATPARYPAPRAAIATDGPPPEVQRSTGPTATSGSARFDEVGRIGGWAGQDVGESVFLAHPTLSVGSFVEVTALDSGRTIAAVVMATGGGPVGDLSPAGLSQLGIAAGDGVRVRSATPPPPDQTALRSGHAATLRIGAPTGLLVALRQRLSAQPGQPAPRASAAPPTRTAPTTSSHAPASSSRPPQPRTSGASYAPPADRPAPRPASSSERTPPPPPRAATSQRPAVQHQAVRGHWFVQVAALSSADRARGLLGQVGGGRVVQTGGIYRVQAGPFADAPAAARARDGIVRRGYAGARVVAGD